MTHLGIPIAWLVLSPLALITNVIAIVIVCHYKGQFHGTDVAFLSLFVTMMMEAVVVVPLPAIMAFLEDDWRWFELCSFYVWVVLCVRMSDLLVMLIVNMHWMCILRFTSGQEVYSSSTVVKILVVIAWVAAVVTGIVPVVGSSFYTYYHETTSKELVGGDGNSTPHVVTTTTGECHFLPEGLGISFVLFFIIITLATVVLSLVASSDTLAVFHYMRKTAIQKYKAGRFYLPSSSLLDSAVNKSLAPQGAGTSSQRHSLSGGSSLDKGENSAEHDRNNSRHQNNGSLSYVHRNGKIPGEHEGKSASPVTTSAENVAVSYSSGGGLSSSTESSPANQLGVYGRGPSRPASAGGEGVARSAAAIVVRPSVKSGVAKSNPPTVHARYNELNLSAELCRVVFCFTLLATLINHLPFVVLQFLQLVMYVDRHHAETTVLWLILIHSLLLPHVLWILSRRYRHALTYTWNVHVLRDESAKEEDPSACTLQSYTRKVQSPDGGTLKVVARPRGHGPITMATYDRNQVPEGQPNGKAIPVRTTSLSSPEVQDTWIQQMVTERVAEDSPLNTSGQQTKAEVMTTDIDDGMTIVTNLASHQVTYIYNTPPDRSPGQHVLSEQHDNSHVSSEASRNISVPFEGSSGLSSRGQANCGSPLDQRKSPLSSQGHDNSCSNSSATVSPSRSSLGTPTRGSTHIGRSGSARQVWKEQMMKKHLPAIFINEAFESDEVVDEQRTENQVQQLPDVTLVAETVKTQSKVEEKKSKDPDFHYYMSGNFHHDFLHSDSLHRLESESDGGSFQYDDNDIEGILDREHSIRSQRVTPLMSTFKEDPQENTRLSNAMDVQTQQSVNSPDLVEPESDRDAANLALGTESVPGSKTQDKARSLPRSRKPRRSAAVLKQSSRPVLHHQRSLHTDPETKDEGPVPNPAHLDSTETDMAQMTFYPTFEPLNREDSKVIPTSDGNAGEEADRDANNKSGDDRSSYAVLTSSDKDSCEAEHSNIVSKVADTDDVFVNIENVTTDSTYTDTVGNTPYQHESPPSSDTGEQKMENFMPQGQASVLGILLDDGTEIPTGHDLPDSTMTHIPVCSSDDHSTMTHIPVSSSDDHIWTASEFDWSPHSNPFHPFSQHDHESVPGSQTNPFLADFDKERGDRENSAGSEISRNQEYWPAISQSDDHNILGDSNDSPIHDKDFFSDTQKIPFSDEQFGPYEFEDDGKHLSVTQANGDIVAPGTAAVADPTETDSVNSEPSVILEPYNVDRRPPWMDADFDDSVPVSPVRKSRNPFRPSFDAEEYDPFGSSEDFGSSFGSNSEIRTIFSDSANRADIGNPFAHDSFSDKFIENSDFLQTSSNHGQQHGEEYESSVFQSYPLFDEETDRGFEDALALENVIGVNSYYGHFSGRFESIEEEPEDFTDSSNSVDKEDNKEFKSGTKAQNSSSDTGIVEIVDPKPSGNMNGNISMTSQSSDPSPVFSDQSSVFASTTPFSPQNSPQRTVGPISGMGKPSASEEEMAQVQPSAFSGDTVQLHEETATAVEDKPLEDSNKSAPVKRVRLTKPIPWKLKNTKSESVESSSELPISNKGDSQTSPTKIDLKDNSKNYDSGFTLENNRDCSKGTNNDETASHAKKPPVLPRFQKFDNTRSGDDDSFVKEIDPVFF